MCPARSEPTLFQVAMLQFLLLGECDFGPSTLRHVSNLTLAHESPMRRLCAGVSPRWLWAASAAFTGEAGSGSFDPATFSKGTLCGDCCIFVSDSSRWSERQAVACRHAFGGCPGGRPSVRPPYIVGLQNTIFSPSLSKAGWFQRPLLGSMLDGWHEARVVADLPVPAGRGQQRG